MPKTKADDNKILSAAKEYVSQQIKTIQDHGGKAKLSASAYKELVREVADAAS